MLNPRIILKEFKTSFYQSFVNHRVPIKLDKAIISITFDDVPRSAFKNGVPILDKYGVKATFYIATGLSLDIANDRINAEGYLRPDDILTLNRSGHHIACHTYSHYMLKKGNAEELLLDANKNVETLKGILGPIVIEHFSYPFGQVSFKAKRLLAENYKTMRSSQPGINNSLADMYFLRATSIYNPTFDRQVLSNVIKQAEQTGGWLILYTHGIEQNPDNYSCTLEQFDWVIQECSNSSAEILPVDQAYNKIIAALAG